MDTEYILRIVLKARDDTARAFAEMGAHLKGLQADAKNMDRDFQALDQRLKTFNTTLSRQTTRIKNLRKEYDELSKTIGGTNRDVDKSGASFSHASNNVEHLSSTTRKTEQEVKKLGTATRKAGDDTDRTGSKVERFGHALTNLEKRTALAQNSLSRMSSSMRGLIVVLAITFAQELTSAIVGLAGAAVGLVTSLGAAATALGGTFTAAAAQTIPVIAGLIAVFQRVSTVMQAVKDQNAQQAYASQDAATAADAQASAQDGVASSARSLADAQRGVTAAQNELTAARKTATDQLRDMTLAESASDLSLRGAKLSLKRAREAMQSLGPDASILDHQEATLAIDEAQQRIAESKTAAQRADEDLAKRRRVGVHGSDPVVQARGALANAERSAADASRSLQQAQEGVAQAIDNASARTEKLRRDLGQLSVAERDLYESFLNIQKTYIELFRPLTDVIVESISKATDRVEVLMRDPKLLGALTGLSKGVASEIDKTVAMLTHGRTKNQLFGFISESSHNLDAVGDIFRNILQTLINIAEASEPAFRKLLSYIDKITKSWMGSTTETDYKGSGISKFMKQGIGDFKAWMGLIGSIIGLFADLSQAGGRASGKTQVTQVTKEIERARHDIRGARDEVKQFFEDSTSTFRDIRLAIYALGSAMIDIFQGGGADSIHELSLFLINTFIPALKDAITTLGFFVRLILSVFNNDNIIGEIGQIVIMVGILSKTFGTLIKILIGLFGGFGRLIINVSTLRNKYLEARETSGIFASALSLLTGKSITTAEAIAAQTASVEALIVAQNEAAISAERMGAVQAEARIAGSIPYTPGVRYTPKGPIPGYTPGVAYTPKAPIAPIVPPIASTVATAESTAARTSILARAGGMAATAGRGLAGLAFGPVGLAALIGGPLIISALSNTSSKIDSLKESAQTSSGRILDLGTNIGDLRSQGREAQKGIEAARDSLDGLTKGTDEYREALRNLRESRATEIASQEDIRNARIDRKEEYSGAISEQQAAAADYRQRISRVRSDRESGYITDAQAEHQIAQYKDHLKSIKHYIADINKAWDASRINTDRVAKGYYDLNKATTRHKHQITDLIAGYADMKDKQDAVRQFVIHTNDPAVLSALDRVANRASKVLGKERTLKILADSKDAKDAIDNLDKKTDRFVNKMDTTGKNAVDNFFNPWGPGFKSIARTADDETAKTAKNTEGNFAGLNKAITAGMTAVQKVVSITLKKTTDDSEKESGKLASGVIGNIGSMQTAAYSGYGYINTATDKALGAYGVDKLNINIPSPKPLNKRERGGPGWVGGKGRREKDEHHIVVGGGEGIFTHDQMPYVEAGLKKTFGYGADELWRRQRNSHSGLPDDIGPRQYAQGGIVPIPGMPGESVFAKILPATEALIKKYKLQVYDGYATSGHATNSDHYWGGALDLGPGPGGSWELVDQLAALAEPVQNQPVSPFRWVGYNGDEGHGTGNHLHLSWNQGGPYGLPASIAKGVAAAGVTRKIKELIVKGHKGAARELIQANMDMTVKAANKYIAKKSNIPNMSGGDAEAFKGGDINEWIATALKYTHEYSPANAEALAGRVMQESSGNPRAINNTDSNASLPTTSAEAIAHGFTDNRSRGIAQTIPDTFFAYNAKGHDDIWNPVDNLIAAIRYMMAQYGHIVGPSGTGYAQGGRVPTHEWGGWKADGMDSVINRPTIIGVGESGPERVTVQRNVPQYGMPTIPEHAFDIPIGKMSDSLKALFKKYFDAKDKDKADILTQINEKIQSTKPQDMGEILDYIRKKRADLRKEDGTREDIAALAKLAKLARQERAFGRIEAREKGLRSTYGTSGAAVATSIAKTEYKLKGSEDGATAKLLNKLFGESGYYSQLNSELQSYFTELASEITDATYRIKRTKHGLQASLKRGPLQQASANVKLAQEQLETANKVKRSMEGDLPDADKAIENARKELKNAVPDHTKEIKKAEEDLKGAKGKDEKKKIQDKIDKLKQQDKKNMNPEEAAKNLQGLVDAKAALKKSLEQQNEQIAAAKEALYQAQLGLEQERLDRINQQADKNNAAADRKSRVLTAMGFSSAARDLLLSSQQQIANNQLKDLKKELKAAEKLGDKDMINAINDQIDELQTSIVEMAAQQFQNSIDEINKKADRKLSIESLREQIATASAALTGTDAGPALVKLKEEKGAILREQAGELQKKLAEATAAGNKDAMDALTEQLLENQLAQIENTQALQDINGTMTLQNFSSSSWSSFREAVFDGNGGLSPRFQSAASAPPTASYGAVGGSGGKPMGSSSNANINVSITETKEKADPQEIGERIAWEMGA